MEENVALDSSKQKKFVKSLKGIKKLIKKNDAKDEAESIATPEIKDGKIYKKKRKQRGLVYLSHIPHGFYEHEMTQYFKQFGVVTNARVIRSKRTGNSKGYAFVEFREPSVAQIVAETMNNYLMGKRLIKAAYFPPEKQRHHALRKRWNNQHNPGAELRIKLKKAYNQGKDDQGELKRARKLLSNISKTKKKLGELGINYDFFTPVDIPEALLSNIEIKQEKDDKEIVIKTESIEKSKKKKKNKKKKAKGAQVVGEVADNSEDKMIVQKSLDISDKTVKGAKPLEVETKKKDKVAKKKSKEETKDDKKDVELTRNQNKKQKELENKGIKPPGDFIKIEDDDDSHDSSYIFDSDEYEKMLENEDELNSNISNNDVSDGDADKSGSDENIDSEESDTESVEDVPPKKNKNKSKPATQTVQMKKNAAKHTAQGKFPQQTKRKAHQNTDVKTKKPKFEKQNKQKPNKQFKKKK